MNRKRVEAEKGGGGRGAVRGAWAGKTLTSKQGSGAQACPIAP
jgi:hypothetical protein